MQIGLLVGSFGIMWRAKRIGFIEFCIILACLNDFLEFMYLHSIYICNTEFTMNQGIILLVQPFITPHGFHRAH